jgi:two-component system, OmpR family, response regulator
MTGSVLMCRPDHFGIEYEINPWMHVAVQVDHALAAAQWDALHSTYVDLGLDIELATPVASLPDMVFTANAAVLWDGRAVLSNFHHAERQGEEVHWRDALERLRFEVHELPRSLSFEGAGDALFFGDRLLCGYGFRTDRESHRPVARILEVEVVSLELIDSRFYHLQRDAGRVDRGLVADGGAARGTAPRRGLRDRADGDGGVPQGGRRRALPLAATRRRSGSARRSSRLRHGELSTASEPFPRIPREDALVPTQSAAEPNRILVVDDERAITDLVAMALKYEGFSVQSAASAKQARHAVMDFRPDLMILDVGLPDEDGFTLVQRLITDGIKVPVIFLTARDATEEKVHGLTIGGDDYVTKPFSIEELVARIRIVLRRHHPAGVATSPKLVLHDLELDDETHEVFRGGAAVELTRTEFRLLRYLMMNTGRVLSRTQILDHVWDYDFGGDASVLETYISYLRRKVDQVEPSLIHTVRGVGYVMRVPRSSAAQA